MSTCWGTLLESIDHIQNITSHSDCFERSSHLRYRETLSGLNKVEYLHRIKDHFAVENEFFFFECATQPMSGAGLTSNDYNIVQIFNLIQAW